MLNSLSNPLTLSISPYPELGWIMILASSIPWSWLPSPLISILLPSSGCFWAMAASNADCDDECSADFYDMVLSDIHISNTRVGIWQKGKEPTDWKI